MSVSDILKKLKCKTGLSSRGLSRALKFPENAFCYYLNGKRKPNLLNCYRIMKFAKKYDVPIKLEELLPE